MQRMSVITAVVSVPEICIRLSSPPLPRLSAAADMCLRSFFQMYTLMLGVAAVWVFFFIYTLSLFSFQMEGKQIFKKKRKVGDVLFIWCQAQNMDIRLKLHWSAKRHRRRAVYVV